MNENIEKRHYVKLSKSGKYVILQTVETVIYPINYFKKLVEPVEKEENVLTELDTIINEVKE